MKIHRAPGKAGAFFFLNIRIELINRLITDAVHI